MSGAALKHCPFCGGQVMIAEIGDDQSHWYYVTRGKIRKTRCTCRVFMESDRFDADAPAAEKAAIKAALKEKWNRRAEE